ncbi:hypothetical protein E2C01_017260 [Portunus trituberculatus]|uniref:Uncharacterized protein n=1 Tax=Portunus trituberculatus TaxID=210409 RepID=A0A5B7DR62_PORTR|nr:hypothetical protein [Portunus trituberculatus]
MAAVETICICRRERRVKLLLRYVRDGAERGRAGQVEAGETEAGERQIEGIGSVYESTRDGARLSRECESTGMKATLGPPRPATLRQGEWVNVREQVTVFLSGGKQRPRSSRPNKQAHAEKVDPKHRLEVPRVATNIHNLVEATYPGDISGRSELEPALTVKTLLIHCRAEPLCRPERTHSQSAPGTPRRPAATPRTGDAAAAATVAATAAATAANAAAASGGHGCQRKTPHNSLGCLSRRVLAQQTYGWSTEESLFRDVFPSEPRYDSGVTARRRDSCLVSTGRTCSNYTGLIVALGFPLPSASPRVLPPLHSTFPPPPESRPPPKGRSENSEDVGEGMEEEERAGDQLCMKGKQQGVSVGAGKRGSSPVTPPFEMHAGQAGALGRRGDTCY